MKSRWTPYSLNIQTVMDEHVTVSAYCQQIFFQQTCSHLIFGWQTVVAIENSKDLLRGGAVFSEAKLASLFYFTFDLFYIFSA